MTVVPWDKVWVWGHSVTGFAVSNSAGGVSLSRECWALSGRGLCDGPVLRQEESYILYMRVCVRVSECDEVQQSPCTPTVSRCR